MKPKLSMLTLPGLTLVGSLGAGISNAYAQSVYVETYAEPLPVLEPYRVVMTPRYVARPAPVVVPPPIVRERTVVVSRPHYVSAPLVGAPLPPYVVADW